MNTRVLSVEDVMTTFILMTMTIFVICVAPLSCILWAGLFR
jgi:hypothetical protein